MTNKPITQSQKRYEESLGPLFNDTNGFKKCLFLTSSTDIGVIRNGGRNGARFAPQSFLSTFKKYAANENLKKYSFKTIEVSNESLEKSDFDEAQKTEARKILEAFKAEKNSRLIHIGGGHDHVYPLLSALSSHYKNVIVINIDAHADTRTDENFHSGTPFRQFAKEFKGEFVIHQLGLHPFANSQSTLSTIEKGTMSVLWRDEFWDKNLTAYFEDIKKTVTPETLVLFSIDADALDGRIIPGVSAVNGDGLSFENLKECWRLYTKLGFSHPPHMGIYELNPLYDTLSSVSMRTMAAFIYGTINI